MTTNNDSTQRMMDAFKRARADIASIVDWFACELEALNDGKATWETVASLERVRQRLIETLEEFSGVEQSQIQRSLDELHS